jgi:hypothetical protein
MKLKEFAQKISELAEECPDAEVRLETFYRNTNSASQLNAPDVFCLNKALKRLTIVGDGEPQKY